MATVPAKTNGTAVKENLLPESKIPPAPFVPKVETEKLPSLEDRMHKLNVLFDLQKKYQKLQSSSSKLAEFEIASDKENSELCITDDDDNEFKTTNPVVIAEVVKLLQKTIKEKTQALDAQIRF